MRYSLMLPHFHILRILLDTVSLSPRHGLIFWCLTYKTRLQDQTSKQGYTIQKLNGTFWYRLLAPRLEATADKRSMFPWNKQSYVYSICQGFSNRGTGATSFFWSCDNLLIQRFYRLGDKRENNLILPNAAFIKVQTITLPRNVTWSLLLQPWWWELLRSLLLT